MEKIAQLFKVLYEEGGFIQGSLLFLIISVVITYALFKKRYSNVFICESLQDVYDELIEKGEGSKISEVLLANGYSVLGHVFIDLLKVAFSLVYVLTLRTEVLSFVDTSVINFPFSDTCLSIIKAGGFNSYMALGIVAFLILVEIGISNIIVSKCFVDSGLVDIIVTFVVGVSALFLPAGYGIFMLALTAAELIITVLNLGPLKRQNMNKIKQTMDRYNARYKAKVLKENDNVSKNDKKPHRQPSELHPSKKKKK